MWLSLKSCLLFSNSSYSCLYTTIEAHFPQPSSHLFPAPNFIHGNAVPPPSWVQAVDREGREGRQVRMDGIGRNKKEK